MTLPAIGAILFDVDETLYDRRRAQRLVLERLPAALPEPFGDISLEAVWEAWQQSDRQTENHVFTVIDIRASRNMRSAIFLRLLGICETHANAVTDFYLETYPTVAAPIDGAVEVVSACAARLPVGVVSNAYPDVQYGKLETLGLRHHFGCIVLSEEYGGPRKPAARIFLRGCELLGSQPASTLYVGDAFGNDVIGARGAGLIPCWYNPRKLPPPEGETAPEFQLRTLRELLALL
jgi:putative hydrolase of the HAD superfamily